MPFATIVTAKPSTNNANVNTNTCIASSDPSIKENVTHPFTATTAICCETVDASNTTVLSCRGTTRPFSTRRSRNDSSVWLSGKGWRSYRIRCQGWVGCALFSLDLEIAKPSFSKRSFSPPPPPRVLAAREERRRSAIPILGTGHPDGRGFGSGCPRESPRPLPRRSQSPKSPRFMLVGTPFFRPKI